MGTIGIGIGSESISLVALFVPNVVPCLLRSQNESWSIKATNIENIKSMQNQVLCEKCQVLLSTVHISGWRIPVPTLSGNESRIQVEHHFCEKCAALLKQTDPLLNPLLRLGPSARAFKSKVVRVSSDTVEVAAIAKNQEHSEEHFVFRKSRFPEEYAVEDMEFEMVLTEDDLKRLQAED